MSYNDGSEAPGLSPAEEEQLTRLAKEYDEAREAATEATNRKDAARQQILALLGDVEKAAAGPFFISAKAQTRKTLDPSALRIAADQAGFDLRPYEKVSTTRVLRIIS